MIHDLDATLEKIIYSVGKINKSDVDISFEQPNRDWSARINRPTLNLWAFDMRENSKLRNTTRNIEPSTNGRSTNITMPPKRINISYWVTAWARKIEDEHQLLWRALAALKFTYKISPRDTVGNLRQSTIDIPLQTADMVENPINMSDLWGVLDNSMRLGFLLIATLELDLGYEVETPLVLEKTFRIGQSDDPTEQRIEAYDTPITQKGAKPDKTS
jgi:hypothetical protein